MKPSGSNGIEEINLSPHPFFTPPVSSKDPIMFTSCMNGWKSLVFQPTPTSCAPTHTAQRRKKIIRGKDSNFVLGIRAPSAPTKTPPTFIIWLFYRWRHLHRRNSILPTSRKLFSSEHMQPRRPCPSSNAPKCAARRTGRKSLLPPPPPKARLIDWFHFWLFMALLLPLRDKVAENEKIFSLKFK